MSDNLFLSLDRTLYESLTPPAQSQLLETVKLIDDGVFGSQIIAWSVFTILVYDLVASIHLEIK